MKLVTLTRDLRPWRENDRVPVPDKLADELVETGDARDPEVFHSLDDNPSVAERVKNTLRETLRLPPGRYRTRDGASPQGVT